MLTTSTLKTTTHASPRQSNPAHAACPPFRWSKCPFSIPLLTNRWPRHKCRPHLDLAPAAVLSIQHSFPLFFLFYSHLFLAYLYLSYCINTSHLAPLEINQSTIFIIISVCNQRRSFPHFLCAPTGGRAINNRQSASPFFPFILFLLQTHARTFSLRYTEVLLTSGSQCCAWVLILRFVATYRLAYCP